MKILRNMPAALAAIVLTSAAAAAQQPAQPVPVIAPISNTAPSPNEIVAAAPASDWTAIAASDLLVMDLAPDAQNRPRRVIIQLMPPPFSQGWVGNIRKLAAAKFWDGTSINRVQDNYVTQWGDASEKKALPEGLAVMESRDYSLPTEIKDSIAPDINISGSISTAIGTWDDPKNKAIGPPVKSSTQSDSWKKRIDSYGWPTAFVKSWPVAVDPSTIWPTHCYGMVGVGRNYSPDTGTGAELYTVIGHAPRHLDRNIALVGRVIEGMEFMSSLPRGTGALGFYEKEEERTPILSVRIGSDIIGLPAFEYLNTDSATFAAYADARANRRDPFFIQPAGGADICNIPVPVRRVKG